MTDRPHLIVLPGGGYAFRAAHEGEPVAEWLRSLGLDASVFAYPVKTRHPSPIDAMRRRVAELRADGVERLGVVGFSAGGHLAGHAAALGLVDAAVLCYPVVSMITRKHTGSRRELLGRWATPWARAAVSVERLVTPSMPATFVWHTAEDETVPLEHPYLLGRALARHDVPHAMHIYPHGRHGLGMVTGIEGGEHAGSAANWTRDCAEWLRELGWID